MPHQKQPTALAESLRTGDLDEAYRLTLLRVECLSQVSYFVGRHCDAPAARLAKATGLLSSEHIRGLQVRAVLPTLAAVRTWGPCRLGRIVAATASGALIRLGCTLLEGFREFQQDYDANLIEDTTDATDALPKIHNYLSTCEELRESAVRVPTVALCAWLDYQLEACNFEELQAEVHLEYAAARRLRTEHGLQVKGAKDASREGAKHSPDFRCVHWFGREYTFTATQGRIVAQLWAAWENNTPDVGHETLLQNANADTARLADLFKKTPAWMKMIVPGTTKGTAKLQTPGRKLS